MLPDPVPRDGERALARWGLLGEGAEPVFTPGARYPLAGLLLALPALEATGLLDAARAGLRPAQGRVLRAGRHAADLGVPGPGRGAAGRGRHPGPARRRWAGCSGLDRAPEVKTIRRKLGELAAAGKAADLIMALARRHAAARPGRARVPLRRRARPRLLRDPDRAEDAHRAAEVPRPGHRGDLGHRPGRRPGVHGGRRAVRLAGRRAAPAAARSCGRSSARAAG